MFSHASHPIASPFALISGGKPHHTLPCAHSTACPFTSHPPSPHVSTYFQQPSTFQPRLSRRLRRISLWPVRRGCQWLAGSHRRSIAARQPRHCIRCALDAAAEARARSWRCSTSLTTLSFTKRLFVTISTGTGRTVHSRSDAKRKHVQIATVDPITLRPSVRTVVFRGFLPQKCDAIPFHN